MHKNRLKKSLLMSAALLTGAIPGAALAQGGIDEIIVRAQLREQSLQSVPASVQAFTADQIESAGIRTTEDFVGLTPNLTFDDSFTYLNSFVVVRGVTQVNNADAPIAIIVDGVPQNNQKQFKQPLFDVEQIEILKGPQGSLYGRNAIGGAINITTKQPTNEFEGFIGGGISNGVGYRAEAGISGPIVEDKVLFRVAGSFYSTDGLIENTFLGDDVDDVDHDVSIRGKLKVNFSESFEADFRVAYNDFEAGSSYDTIVNNTANTPTVPLFRAGTSNDIFSPTSDFRGFTEGNVFELSAKFDLNLQFATASYIVGYTDIVEDYRADLDFSNPTQPSGIFGGFNLGQGQNLDVELLSHELRFVSPDDQRFRWILGGYYISTQRDLLTRVFVDLDNTPGQFETGIRLVQLNEENDNDAWAIFGQVEFDITEDLTLQVGGRYDQDNRDQIIPGVPGSGRRVDFDSFQPKVTLSYQATDDVLGYFTYSTGFRSGGLNAPGVVLPTFDDETLTNFEIGAKTKLFGGRGVFNIAGFYSESEDFQFFFVDVTTGSQIISNLGEVDIIGFDADFSFFPSDNLALFGGVGFTDSEIKSIGNPALEAFLASAGVPRSSIIGSRSPKTTEWTVNLGGEYSQPVTGEMDLIFRVDYEFQGEKFWQIDNLDVRDPIHLLGLRATLETERFSAAVWAKNLLDEEYYADFNPSEFAGGGFDLGFQARPRTFGADVKVKF